ncbi:MAG: cyclodeaminase/cyclohydrolase family protein [Gemmatimonadota bacterium]
MQQHQSIEQWSDAVAAGTAAPGGGSVAAVAGALAAALVAMVARLTVGRPRHAEVDAEFRKTIAEADALRAQLLILAEDDWRVYGTVVAALKLPKEPEEAARQRTVALQSAWRKSAQVPLEVLRIARDVSRLARRGAESGNPNTLGEAGVAALLAHAVGEASLATLRLNLKSVIDQEEVQAVESEARGLFEAIGEDTEVTRGIVQGKIGELNERVKVKSKG